MALDSSTSTSALDNIAQTRSDSLLRTAPDHLPGRDAGRVVANSIRAIASVTAP